MVQLFLESVNFLIVLLIFRNCVLFAQSDLFLKGMNLPLVLFSGHSSLFHCTRQHSGLILVQFPREFVNLFPELRNLLLLFSTSYDD